MADSTISGLPSASALTGAELIELVQGGANVKSTIAAILALITVVSDHGSLTGLLDDDHPQYHNDTRGDLRYALIGRQVLAGNGLTGGGTLAADRTLNVGAGAGIAVNADDVALDINGLTVLAGAIDGANDLLPVYDASTGQVRKVSVTNAVSGASGTVPNTRLVTAGNGLSGGGALSADIQFDVGAGVGIQVLADTVGLDTANTRNVDHATVAVSAGTGLTGGGNLDSSRTVSLDLTNPRNVDHSSVSITAGAGLTGGGDITASRSLAVADNGVTLAKLQDIATASLLGRSTAGVGDPEVLTAAQATALLPLFDTANKGLVPTPGAGAGQRVLLANGTWSAFYQPIRAVKGGVIAGNGVAQQLDFTGGMTAYGLLGTVTLSGGRIQVVTPGLFRFSCFAQIVPPTAHPRPYLITVQMTANNGADSRVSTVYVPAAGANTGYAATQTPQACVACAAGQFFDVYLTAVDIGGSTNLTINAEALIEFMGPS